MRKLTVASLGLAFLLGAVLSSAYLYAVPPATLAGAGIGTPAVELATPGPEPTAPVVIDAPAPPAAVRPPHSAPAPPKSAPAPASSPRLGACPVPGWTAREWITTHPVAAHTTPDPASPTYGTIPVGSHIQGCVRPDGWAAVTMYGWVDTATI